MEINNASQSSLKPVEFSIKVDKPQQQEGVKQLSTPVDIAEKQEYKIELSQLAKKLETISRFDEGKAKRISDILKNANETNTREDSYNYGKTEEELIKENGEDLKIPEKNARENKSAVAEESPASKVSEKMKNLQDKTGELVKKHPSMPGGDKEVEEQMTETDKINEEIGNISRTGVVDTENKNDPDEVSKNAQNKIENLQNKTGELVEKHPKMAGADDAKPIADEKNQVLKAESLSVKNEPTLSTAEIANQKLNELKDKTAELVHTMEALSGKEEKGNKVVKNLPRTTQTTPAAEAQKNIADMQNKKGEVVDNHPDLPGEKKIQELPPDDDKLDEVRAEIAKTVKNMTLNEIEMFLPTSVSLEDNIAEFVQKIDALPVEQRNKFLGTAENLEGEELEEFISTTKNLEGNKLKSYVDTANDLSETGGPNIQKFMKTVSNMESDTHLGETDLERFIESVQKRSGVERTLFLLGRYMQAFY